MLCKLGKIILIVFLLRLICGEKFLLWYICICIYVKDLIKVVNSYVVENENNFSVLLFFFIVFLVLNKIRKLILFVKSVLLLFFIVEYVSFSMVVCLLLWDILFLIYRVYLEECFLILIFRKVNLRIVVLC